jgi:hypothetical protein
MSDEKNTSVAVQLLYFLSGLIGLMGLLFALNNFGEFTVIHYEKKQPDFYLSFLGGCSYIFIVLVCCSFSSIFNPLLWLCKEKQECGYYWQPWTIAFYVYIYLSVPLSDKFFRIQYLV